MKKHLSALLLAAMVLSLAACAAPETPAVSPLTTNQRYALEKLDQVNDMVLARETVPADYLRYLPDDLAQLVEEYNDRTGELRVRFTVNAKNIVRSLLYDLEDRTAPPEYEYPELYYDWVGRISHYALFENITELCENDPSLSYPLCVEGGGSYGMWALPGHFYKDEDVQLIEDYLLLVEQLLDAFDAAREAAGPAA